MLTLTIFFKKSWHQNIIFLTTLIGGMNLQLAFVHNIVLCSKIYNLKLLLGVAKANV